MSLIMLLSINILLSGEHPATSSSKLSSSFATASASPALPSAASSMVIPKYYSLFNFRKMLLRISLQPLTSPATVSTSALANSGIRTPISTSEEINYLSDKKNYNSNYLPIPKFTNPAYSSIRSLQLITLAITHILEGNFLESYNILEEIKKDLVSTDRDIQKYKDLFLNGISEIIIFYNFIERLDFLSKETAFRYYLGKLNETFCTIITSTIIKHYSWSIPTDLALQTIKKYQPIIEVGAGTGYWAGRLAEIGVDIVAYDNFLMDIHTKTRWYEVKNGDEHAILAHSNRTLMLCWPPNVGSTLASSALDLYKGEYLIYIGDLGSKYNITGDQMFFRMLTNNFKIVETIPLKNWPWFKGITNKLYVFKRVSYF